MRNSFIKMLMAGAAVATMGTSAAYAAALDSVAGPVQFLFDGLDSAQTNYTLNAGTIGTSICTTVAGCDAASAPTPDAPGSNQANDTWGITTISSIREDTFGGATLWSHGQDGDVLFTYFHGFNDAQVDHVDPTTVDIFAVGGMVDIYRVDQAFLDGLDMTDQQSIEDDITNAGLSKYLELTFQPGCSLSVAAATLCGTFDADFAAGVSNGFAMATAGDALSKYPEEFQFEQSVEPCGTACDNTSFTLRVRSGSALTTALPEPGALGLLGLGLVGLGLAGRRRKV